MMIRSSLLHTLLILSLASARLFLPVIQPSFLKRQHTVSSRRIPHQQSFLPRSTSPFAQNVHFRGGQEEEKTPDSLHVDETEQTVEAAIDAEAETEAEDEESDLAEDEEAVVEMEFEEDEEYYADEEEIELSEAEVSAADEFSEEQEEEEEKEAIDLVMENSLLLAQKTGVLVYKVSKVSAIWLRQWSYDLYRACERAIDAGKQDMEEIADFNALIAELSEEEEEEPITLKDKIKSKALKTSKKAWRVSKRMFSLATKMTIAFWSDYDDDFLPVEEEEIAEKPIISLFHKLKICQPAEKQEADESETEMREETSGMHVVGGDSSTTSTKRKRRRHSKKQKDEPPAVVTVVPGTRKRNIFFKIAIGVASIALWETAGLKAALLAALAKSQKQTTSWKRQED